MRLECKFGLNTTKQCDPFLVILMRRRKSAALFGTTSQQIFLRLWKVLANILPCIQHSVTYPSFHMEISKATTSPGNLKVARGGHSIKDRDIIGIEANTQFVFFVHLCTGFLETDLTVIGVAILSLLNSIIFVQLFAEYSIIYFTWNVKQLHLIFVIMLKNNYLYQDISRNFSVLYLYRPISLRLVLLF